MHLSKNCSNTERVTLLITLERLSPGLHNPHLNRGLGQLSSLLLPPSHFQAPHTSLHHALWQVQDRKAKAVTETKSLSLFQLHEAATYSRHNAGFQQKQPLFF